MPRPQASSPESAKSAPDHGVAFPYTVHTHLRDSSFAEHSHLPSWFARRLGHPGHPVHRSRSFTSTTTESDSGSRDFLPCAETAGVQEVRVGNQVTNRISGRVLRIPRCTFRRLLPVVSHCSTVMSDWEDLSESPSRIPDRTKFVPHNRHAILTGRLQSERSASRVEELVT